jgi:hypothetical protein
MQGWLTDTTLDRRPLSVCDTACFYPDRSTLTCRQTALKQVIHTIMTSVGKKRMLFRFDTLRTRLYINLVSYFKNERGVERIILGKQFQTIAGMKMD